MRAVRVLFVAGICTTVLTACTSSESGTPTSAPTSPSSPAAPTSPPAPPTPSAPPSSAASPVAPPTPITPAQRAFDAMTEAQRVGQLFMVDCPSSGVAAATITDIQTYHVGSVILDGNSTLGVTRTLQMTAQLQQLAPHAIGLFISTDQEGGLVQRMQGPGFSSIPSAVVQGTEAPATLQANVAAWGSQLHAAGINVDLAPVLDTVPPGLTDNPPIGQLDREYGRTPAAVAAHGVAVVDGLAAAQIDATAKHFPGLGRVTANTDTNSGVTDNVTTRHDAYLAPFAAAINHHIPFVMMSTAIYARIDPGRPAAFSPTIVTGMLRQDLGFQGVIITDDLGAAAQVANYTPAQRAIDFIAAGGTMLLTVASSVVPAMTSALLARAARVPAFKKLVDAAVLTVLRAKQARGLL